MFSARTSVFASSLFVVSIAVLAQERPVRPVITASGGGGQIRFSAADTICQIRMRVLSAAGEVLFDSTWKDGDVLDWTADPPLLNDGSYRCAVMVRDLDGEVIEREATLAIRSGAMSIEKIDGGLAIVPSDESAPKITLLAHDGTNGAIVSTNGDLSFRFGNFLAGKDSERMRLTAAGALGIGTDKPQAPLDVRGLMRTSEGVMFPDGTILTSAAGLPGERETIEKTHRTPVGTVPGSGNSIGARANGARAWTPHPEAGSYQFTVDGAGITSAGNLNLPTTSSASAGVIMVGGNRFAHRFPAIYNTFLGTVAGNFSMTGMYNTGIGFSTLASNSSGASNSALGLSALTSNTTGSENAAVGAGALPDNNGGSYNTASGYEALGFNTIGNYNTGIGYNAVYYNTSGSFNTGLGQSALYNATGDYNIGVGPGAGYNLTTGSNNIDIGNSGVAGETGVIRIGSFFSSKAFISGIYGVTTAAQAVGVVIDSNGQLGTVSSSRRYKFDIADMGDATSDVMRLRPVMFRYIAHGDHAPRQYGLIAEEVAKIYPEMVTRDAGGEPDAVMYQYLAPMLLNEVQKQRKTIEELEKRLEQVETLLARLQN